MFGQFEPRESQPIAEMNVVPLVDVMLVLVIILMVTMPLMTQALRVDLPQTQAQSSSDLLPQRIQLGVNAVGQIHWEDVPIDIAQLQQRLVQAARQDPQPEIHLVMDREARYEVIAQLLNAAQQAGLYKIGFVTQPRVE